MKKTKILLSVLITVTTLFIACNKEENTTPVTPEVIKPTKEQAEISLTTGQKISEFASMEMEKTIDHAIELVYQIKNPPGGPRPSYPKIKYIDEGWYLIDYGYSCLGVDNIVRSGMFLFKLSDSVPKIGTKYTFSAKDSLNKYTVNGYIVRGTVTKTITELVPFRKAGITESIQIICPNKIDVYTRSSAITRIYDSIQIVSDGVVTNNEFNALINYPIKYTATPPKKLIYIISSKEIVSGILNVQIAGFDTVWTIDFGSGISDGKATISDGVKNWEIDIKMNN